MSFGDKLYLNDDLPCVLHIDLNSCFAVIEQQANRLLRGKPVGVAAYDTPRGFVLAASYEAKARGVKLGVNVEQARRLAPGIVIMPPDPSKYREAHSRFKQVLLAYSPDVHAKSIDEFVVDVAKSPVLRNTTSKIRSLKQAQSPKTSHRKLFSTCQIIYNPLAPCPVPHDSEAAEERCIHNQAMVQIGKKIKAAIAESLGEWVTVNIGIAPNRFLAKYAAGFDKPNGMTLINHANLRSYYRCGTRRPHTCARTDLAQEVDVGCRPMKLVDLPGINVRYRARLRAAGIYTPLDFLEADLIKLKKQVFKSINGYHWYRRLRGYEADAVEFDRRSIGHQYALKDKTTDIEKLERLLMKLCEKTGRRLRQNNYYAQGIHLYLGFASGQPYYDGPASFENMPNIKSWSHGEKVPHRLYSTLDIYEAAKRLLYQAAMEESENEEPGFAQRVRLLSVNVFNLHLWDPEQLSIFDAQGDGVLHETGSNHEVQTNFRSVNARKRTSDAIDAINNRYGEFVVTPAAMLEMQGTILDRIAFGQVRDIK